MKKIACVLLACLPLLATAGRSNLDKVPELVQLEVQGDETAPFFTPETMELTIEQPYVMVIMNNKPFAVAFEYTGLGQAVRSQSLKGSSSVTTESIILSPNSKVQWQFTPVESGKFDISASNIAFRLKGKVGKIEVKEKDKNQA